MSSSGRSINGDLVERLTAIVRAVPKLMRVLQTARALDLPDWLVFSGAVYQPVLNHLTGGRPITASATTMSAISMPPTSLTRRRTP